MIVTGRRFISSIRIWSRGGFTLVELMIAMVVSIISMGVFFSVYTLQQRYHRDQQLVLTAQQNLRASMLIIEKQIRMAGYDPLDSGQFGIVDIRRYDLVNKTQLNLNGLPVFYYTRDENEDGELEENSHHRRKINKEHLQLRVSDFHGDGHICLTWDNGSGHRPLSENIVSIGFAYAFDLDNDGYLDCWHNGRHTIWAVDSDNDNLLDTHIDTNDDGLINEKDDRNNDFRIDSNDGGKILVQVPLEYIRAVRVWLLAKTAQPVKIIQGRGPFVVGNCIVPSIKNGCAAIVAENFVMCRNL